MSVVFLIAAATKSLQSCPTLCDPIDSSPPGSAVPGILQVRTLEWVAISFSNAWKWKVKVKSLSRVRPSATPWTAAFQAPLSMGFSRQEYWSGVPLPSLISGKFIYLYIYINQIFCNEHLFLYNKKSKSLIRQGKQNPEIVSSLSVACWHEKSSKPLSQGIYWGKEVPWLFIGDFFSGWHFVSCLFPQNSWPLTCSAPTEPPVLCPRYWTLLRVNQHSSSGP